jgi:hypothetical protein
MPGAIRNDRHRWQVRGPPSCSAQGRAFRTPREPGCRLARARPGDEGEGEGEGREPRLISMVRPAMTSAATSTRSPAPISRMSRARAGVREMREMGAGWGSRCLLRKARICRRAAGRGPLLSSRRGTRAAALARARVPGCGMECGMRKRHRWQVRGPEAAARHPRMGRLPWRGRPPAPAATGPGCRLARAREAWG